MKRLILIMSFILIGVLGYSQSGLRPIKKVSVLNATTEFGENIPTETEVTNMATGEIWECRTATASDETLTTAAANFTIVNGANTDSQDLSYDAANHKIDITGGSSATIPLAKDDGATEGLASFTATDFNETSGNVSIDYTNGQKATNAQAGFATADQIQDIETNNAKLSANTTNVTNAGALMDSEVDADIKTLSLPASTTISTFGKSLIDDADAATARTTLNVDEAGTDNSTPVTLNASATTGGLSITGQEISNQAATSGQNGYMTSDYASKLDGIQTGAEVNLTTFVESFEETSSTAATHNLSYTAIGAIKVSFNGVVLKPSQYTATSTTVHIDIPVSQYDGLVVYYSY